MQPLPTNGKQVLRLRDANKVAPLVDPVEACKKSLTLALYDAIGEADITEIAGMIMGKAKKGDMAAVKLLLSLIQVQPSRENLQAVQVNIDKRRLDDDE